MANSRISSLAIKSARACCGSMLISVSTHGRPALGGHPAIFKIVSQLLASVDVDEVKLSARAAAFDGDRPFTPIHLCTKRGPVMHAHADVMQAHGMLIG